MRAIKPPRSDPRTKIRNGPPRPLRRDDDAVVWKRPTVDIYRAANVKVEPLLRESDTSVPKSAAPDVKACDALPAPDVKPLVAPPAPVAPTVKAEPIDVDAAAPYIDAAPLVAQHAPAAFDVAYLDRVRAHEPAIRLMAQVARLFVRTGGDPSLFGALATARLAHVVRQDALNADPIEIDDD